jgi:hypothetical protein
LSETGVAAIIWQSSRSEADSSQFDEETTMPQHRHKSCNAQPDSFAKTPHSPPGSMPTACPPCAIRHDGGPECRRHDAGLVS